MRMIIGSQKADGFAHGLGPSCSADPMHIVFRMSGKVVVDHMRDPLHVNSPGGDVSGDQHPDPAIFEIMQGAQTLVLGAIGVERGAGDPGRF